MLSSRIKDVKSCVYGIYNTINRKLYIGSTISTIWSRFRDSGYIGHLQKVTCDDHIMYQDMRKFGIHNFKVIVFKEDQPREILNNLERLYITKFSSYLTGYNYTNNGGRSGTHRSVPEDLRKLVSSLQSSVNLDSFRILSECQAAFSSTRRVESSDEGVILEQLYLSGKSTIISFKSDYNAEHIQHFNGGINSLLKDYPILNRICKCIKHEDRYIAIYVNDSSSISYPIQNYLFPLLKELVK